MAMIETTEPVVDADGLVGANGVTVNQTIQAVNKNEPIFGVASSALKGYVAISMYDQISASVIEGAAGITGTYELFSGTSYASGKPYVMTEATWAKNVVTAT